MNMANAKDYNALEEVLVLAGYDAVRLNSNSSVLGQASVSFQGTCFGVAVNIEKNLTKKYTVTAKKNARCVFLG
jgi:hypothetical protein